MKLLISETVEKFSNDDGFRIIVAKVHEVLEGDYSKASITLIGNLPRLSKKEEIVVTGELESHTKHGLNFKVSGYERPIPKNKEQIIRFLSSSMFKGIGIKIAEMIYKELGNRAIEVIGKKGIDALENINIKEEKKMTIVQVVQENFLLDEVIKFYAAYGITAEKVVKLYQIESKNVDILDNPYLFAKHGLIDFKLCDQIALGKGKLPHSYERLEVLFEIFLRDEVRNGHCYVQENDFINRCMTYLNGIVDEKNYVSLPSVIYALSISNVCMAKHARIYPMPLYHAERLLSTQIARRINLKTKTYNYLEVETVLNEISKTATSEQKDAVHKFMENDLLVLTGDAGTGKTFTINLMLQTAKKISPELKIGLAAPTGRAAKRILESLNVEGEASTLHRLLGYGMGGKSNIPYYNEKNPLPYDIVIADEFSMADVVLAKNLLCAMKEGSTLCISGDKDQLESVGAGNVLSDILQTSVPHVHLSEVFRQGIDSKIKTNGKRIKEGKMIDLENHRTQYFIETPTPKILAYVIASIKKLIKQGIDINDIMVLSAMKAGSAGVNALNNAIRELVNPKEKTKRELSFKDFFLREGDKVMCLINDSEMNVYNGDIGIIKRINLIDHELLIDFDGQLVTFKRRDMLDLTLAYAMSIHKSQGNESPYVITIVSDEQLVMLRRNLLYTALTRGSKVNIIIGQTQSIKYAISKIGKPRRTSLAEEINKKVNYKKVKTMVAI